MSALLFDFTCIKNVVTSQARPVLENRKSVFVTDGIIGRKQPIRENSLYMHNTERSAHKKSSRLGNAAKVSALEDRQSTARDPA